MMAELERQYQNFTQADMTKFRETGYTEPATTLEDGVRQTVAAEASLFAQGD